MSSNFVIFCQLPELERAQGNRACFGWSEQRAITVANTIAACLVIALVLGTSQYSGFQNSQLRVVARFKAALAVGQVALVFHNDNLTRLCR